jgi:hypothetical protein
VFIRSIEWYLYIPSEHSVLDPLVHPSPNIADDTSPQAKKALPEYIRKQFSSYHTFLALVQIVPWQYLLDPHCEYTLQYGIVFHDHCPVHWQWLGQHVQRMYRGGIHRSIRMGRRWRIQLRCVLFLRSILGRRLVHFRVLEHIPIQMLERTFS